MNVLIIILSIIAAAIALLLLIGLFTKKHYGVNRNILINEQTRPVFNYIKLLKNQENYSKWNTMDSHMKKEYTGTDGQLGFVAAWDSKLKSVGKGEQEIVGIKDGERVDFKLRFMKPFSGIADSYMVTEMAGSNQTKVSWGFNSKMKYPMNVLLLFMNMDKMIGKDFEYGLNQLKTILEK